MAANEIQERMWTMSGDAAHSDPVAAEWADLLQRVRSGERAAFEELMLRHERLVFRTAWRLLGDREEARNAAQEVFLRLHRFLDRFDERRDFEPWLYRLIVNVCRDLRRRRPRLEPLPADANDPVGAIPALIREPDQEASMTRDEARCMVAEALRALPPKERAAVVLRDIEGLSAAEAARILGSSAGTVRSQACAGRIKIRRFTERFLRRRP